MPLHDWSDRPGWEGMHLLWIAELLRWVKPRLPEGYRTFLGSTPRLAVGAPAARPDLGVREWTDPATPGRGAGDQAVEPDEEVAVATIEPDAALFVERAGRLVAAVELVSPRNKDRPLARSTYLARYLGYLLDGVHLLLVDAHPRPAGFSMADRIAAELQLHQPPLPTPLAVSYRVGEPAPTGGRLLALWRRPLAIGQPLPALPLALTTELAVTVDLESTYTGAATDSYLD